MVKHRTVQVTAQITAEVPVSGPATDAVREAKEVFSRGMQALNDVKKMEFYGFDFDPEQFPEIIFT